MKDKIKDKIKICLIGAGFIGKKHAWAYRNQKEAKLQVVCDINEVLAKEVAKECGFERVETNWHKAISAEDVDLVCICVPNKFHFEIVSEAIKEGKHVICEKPLGLNSDESKKLANLAKEKIIVSACCYNILRIPAIVYANKIIKSGKLGKIICFRASYDNDRLANPAAIFEWRMLKKNASGGALSDLAINVLAVSQFLIGDILSVCGMASIVYKKRNDCKGNLNKVENDDIVQFICSYNNGTMGYISSNRVAPGSKQDMRFEIQLTEGAIKFSLERMNEIKVYKIGDNGFSTVISEGNKWFCEGYEDLKTIDAHYLLNSIKNNIHPDNDFYFAMKIDCVIDGVSKSIKNNKWINIDYNL